MNWAALALSITAVIAAVWLVLLIKSRRSFISIYVSLGFLLTAAMNSAAPVRASVDPNYIGYAFGMLRAERGLRVTLIAGGVFLLSAACAFIAARNRRGAAMWIVAAASAAFCVIKGWPWLHGVVTNPDANIIQFGEYLTIPGLVGSLLLGLLLVVPFVIGIPWAARAAAAPE
jgi:hypothetical protein